MVTQKAFLLKRFRNVGLAHISHICNHFFKNFYSMFIISFFIDFIFLSIQSKSVKKKRKLRKHVPFLLNGLRYRNFLQLPPCSQTCV